MGDNSFQAFVRLCDKEGFLRRPPGLGPEDVCDGLNDEATLRRFFNGCVGKADVALQQFKESVEDRKRIGDIATFENIEVKDYELSRTLYPHWSGRRDKRGHPVCVFDLASLDNEAMANYEKTRKISSCPESQDRTGSHAVSAAQQAFAFHDTLTRFILPLCSFMKDRPNPDCAITSAVYLVDVSSFGFKQAWALRGYAQDISKLLATSYPEVVDSVLVLNAPSYFGKIWSFLRRWVDKRTADKLVFLSPEEVLPRLRDSIDLANIPKQYGGGLAVAQGMLPKLDEDICKRLDWTSEPSNALPAGPIKWILDDQGHRCAVAVGRVDGKQRQLSIATLREV